MNSELLNMGRKNRRLISLLLILSFLISPFFGLTETRAAEKPASTFKKIVDKNLAITASALDKATVALFNQLDRKDNISVKIHSHFYDSEIRRYFISVSGEILFSGRLPAKINADSYTITGDQEVSFDVQLSNFRTESKGIRFNYNAAITVNLERLAYRMIQVIPHLTASGALSPALEVMTEFLNKLNIGILSEAISETFRRFSTVALVKTATELISAAGNNRSLIDIIKQNMKNGSILTFLAFQIMRCSTISLVSVAGASLGAMVGSMIAPGPGSIIGGFLGSQILTIAARYVIYELTAELPLKRNVTRIVTSYAILQKNPSDTSARAQYEDSMAKIEKKVKAEFNSERFKLFETLLDVIDKLSIKERPAMIPLLRNLKDALQFKVINEKDWYYARKYYLLKQYVDKWQLDRQVVFTTTR